MAQTSLSQGDWCDALKQLITVKFHGKFGNAPQLQDTLYWNLIFLHETHPYYNLTVKVLRARNIHGLDLLSKADCYVALKLPTAFPLVKRTPVVYNSSDPEWNEIFEYKIHGAVKNILELTFYNRDIVLSSLSNHATSITFDTGNIVPGEILNHTFALNSQEKRAELDVQFSLEER
ncbi:cytosolic phospholipase A2 zeta-like [Rhineura floridana]|uniref:cytosolic phospholipase A2 zeta-like n=1 Tax=Rhineura floridana TaxID=261503 RepID=UPI002AC880BF|nr:cytosolic phospholipase A2 zeta-like [Rhineura floridana]